MRQWFALAMATGWCIVGLALALSGGGGDAISPASRTASTASCPVTRPNGYQTPGWSRDRGGFGNETLWTNLFMWGEGRVRVPDDGRVEADGTIRDLKWA